MPFTFQYAQPRMWNKPSVHMCGCDGNLIIQITVPDYCWRRDVGKLKTPRPCIKARIGDGAFGSSTQPLPEAVQDRNAETGRQHGAIRLWQAAEPQQKTQQPGRIDADQKPPAQRRRQGDGAGKPVEHHELCGGSASFPALPLWRNAADEGQSNDPVLQQSG